MERIARGAGATRWFLARVDRDVHRVFGLLKAGSRVTFYFAGPLRVERLGEPVIGDMFAAVGVADEIVIGTLGSDSISLETELVLGPSELTEFLLTAKAEMYVVWGAFPGENVPDAITISLVDADGILRGHPH